MSVRSFCAFGMVAASLAVMLVPRPASSAGRSAWKGEGISPALSVTVGLAYLPSYSYLKLQPGRTVGFKFQAATRHGTGLSPYFFYVSSTNKLETLEPYAHLLGTEDEHGFRIDPSLRSSLLEKGVRFTAYGMGLDCLVMEGDLLQPYVGLGIGGGALAFRGKEAEERRLGAAGIVIHASAGLDVFLYGGLALGFEVKVLHLFSDNPFDKDADQGRGLSMVTLSGTLKYWDR